MRPARSPALVVISEEPFNAETPLDGQVGRITPNDRHYVRSHFAVPPALERVAIDGLVERPLELEVAELRRMAASSELVTLECAGNGRSFVQPPAPGEQWGLGAVGTAEWTGVPLADLLALARPRGDARHVRFVGADRGVPKDVGREIPFERSLPLAEVGPAMPLVAYAMNGEPLPPDHGAPLRLIVAGQYGMASVKWLARITLAADPATGFFQRDRYVIDDAPLPPIAPRAVITAPSDGARVPAGALVVRGYAWAGATEVTRVEVSIDGGAHWAEARLADARSPYAWREWGYACELRGDHVLVARAETARGDRQPLDQRRTALGYMNNAARPVRVSAA